MLSAENFSTDANTQYGSGSLKCFSARAQSELGSPRLQNPTVSPQGPGGERNELVLSGKPYPDLLFTLHQGKLLFVKISKPFITKLTQGTESS